MENSPKTACGDDRRGFIVKASALVLGAVSLLAPVATGVVAFFNPLRQKAQGGRAVRLASLHVLPEDGIPRKFPVIADRTDAWNRFPNEPIGAVFLRKTGNKDRPVEAINVVCPHAGCSIQYSGSPEGGKFFCPCHTASFDLAGKRLDANSPSPRDLDTLDVQIDNGTEIWVKFQDFRTGTSRKTART